MSQGSEPQDAVTTCPKASIPIISKPLPTNHKAPHLIKLRNHNYHLHKHKQLRQRHSAVSGLNDARKTSLMKNQRDKKNQVERNAKFKHLERSIVKTPSKMMMMMMNDQVSVGCNLIQQSGKNYLRKINEFSLTNHLVTATIFVTMIISLNHITSIYSQESHQQQQQQQPQQFQRSPYRLNNPPSLAYGGPRSQQQQQQANGAQQATGNPAIVPQVWARGLVPEYQDESLRDHEQNDQSLNLIVRRNSNKMMTTPITTTQTTNNHNNNNNNMMKSVRHIVTSNSGSSGAAQLKSNTTTTTTTNDDICSDRLCYGLPMGCLGGSSSSASASVMGTMMQPTVNNHAEQSGSLCSVLVTSKRFIDPNRPFSRDILFELIALPVPEISNYAAVGFSETGRMQGLVSECLQYKDAKTQLQIIKLKHSYNTPGMYSNVPVTILSGIKNLGVSYENGYYQCRWIVESAVEFSYEASNGTIINRREDLGYKNYHILLASGEYNEFTDGKRKFLSNSYSLII